MFKLLCDMCDRCSLLLYERKLSEYDIAVQKCTCFIICRFHAIVHVL